MKTWTPEHLWEVTLGSLELQVSRPSFSTWLKQTIGISWDGSSLVVGAHSSFVAEWLEKRMSVLVEEAVSKIVAFPVDVRFKVVTSFDASQPSESGIPSITPRPHTINMSNESSFLGTKLNTKYTLSSFVVGTSNQLAYAAAVAVSSRPGKAYNPLFLHSGVGLGKTHLLHAIGNESVGNGLSCLYVTSEQFTNDFITSIQTKQTKSFRDRYRSIDVLLVDDVQFFRGKDSIQEGFFHTFNDLHNSDRQIVIASDRPSGDLSLLEDRLKSRLEWGLSAEMDRPDWETRVAILQKKAGVLGITLPDDVLNMLSQTFLHSIRQLEGALNRLHAFSDLTQRPMSLTTAQHALADLMSLNQHPSPPSTSEVLLQVCALYDISLASLASKKRTKALTQARRTVIYLLREDGQCTLTAIGHLLGGRDHTTIRHMYNQVVSQMPSDQLLQKDIRTARDAIATSAAG